MGSKATKNTYRSVQHSRLLKILNVCGGSFRCSGPFLIRFKFYRDRLLIERVSLFTPSRAGALLEIEKKKNTIFRFHLNKGRFRAEAKLVRKRADSTLTYHSFSSDLYFFFDCVYDHTLFQSSQQLQKRFALTRTQINKQYIFSTLFHS